MEVWLHTLILAPNVDEWSVGLPVDKNFDGRGKGVFWDLVGNK